MGGKLLDEHPDWRFNAILHLDAPIPGPDGIVLESSSPNCFSIYAEGYKRLADIGVAHVEGSHVDAATLVYPVVFCYRHYIELRLKELILTAGDLLDRKLALPTSHNLLQIWQSVRPLLREIWPKANEELHAVEQVVSQFAYIDKSSEEFRYPIDKRGKPYLSDLERINILQVKEVIDRIAPTLNGASYAIEEYIDSKGEMLAEARYEEMLNYEPPDYS